jgi:hypothetical protein
VQHGVQHVPREVDARPALLRPLREQAARLELADRAARRGVGDLEDPLGLGHRHGRRAEELVGQAQGVALDPLAVALVVADERARLTGRALGRRVDALAEEREPRRPLVVRAHTLQERVVLVAVTLEDRREVQQRPREALTLDEEQRDEQPPRRPLPPTNGWMPRTARGASAHWMRSGAGRVPAGTLERGQRLGSPIDRGRHVGGGGHGGAGRPEQFCEVRNSPGVRAPTSPRSSRSCSALMNSRESGLPQQLHAEAQVEMAPPSQVLARHVWRAAPTWSR